VLQQAGQTIAPAEQQLTGLEDLYALASPAVMPSAEIKTAN
jgi:hypothetical protein